MNKKKSSTKLSTAIACFVDGTGNDHSAHSNIDRMFNEAATRSEIKVEPKYLPGPGYKTLDLKGKVIAHTAMDIVDEMYAYIAEWYSFLSRFQSEIPIDLYGFSRGAAIMNEVAWELDTKGIQKKGQVIFPPHSVKVRFLGLFDTVHSIGAPGLDTSREFHNTHIAPIVENTAHAFSYDETRTYFAPSILKGMPGKPQPNQMIFPGVHSDIGGHNDNNSDIMALTCSWMSEQASKAGATYLEKLIISEEQRNAILSSPARIEPGPMGAPYEDMTPGDINPLILEHERIKFINNLPLLSRAALQSAVGIATPFNPILRHAVSGGVDSFQQQHRQLHAPRHLPDDIPRILPKPFMQ